MASFTKGDYIPARQSTRTLAKRFQDGATEALKVEDDPAAELDDDFSIEVKPAAKKTAKPTMERKRKKSIEPPNPPPPRKRAKLTAIVEEVAEAEEETEIHVEGEVSTLADDAPTNARRDDVPIQQPAEEISKDVSTTAHADALPITPPSTNETPAVELATKEFSKDDEAIIPEPTTSSENNPLGITAAAVVDETAIFSAEDPDCSISADVSDTVALNDPTTTESVSSSPLSTPPDSPRAAAVNEDEDNIIVTTRASVAVLAGDLAAAEDSNMAALTPPDSQQSEGAVSDPSEPQPADEIEAPTDEIVYDDATMPDTPKAQMDDTSTNAQLPTPPSSAEVIKDNPQQQTRSGRKITVTKRFAVDATEAVEGESSGEEQLDEVLDAETPEQASSDIEADLEDEVKKPKAKNARKTTPKTPKTPKEPNAKPERRTVRKAPMKPSVEKVSAGRVTKTKATMTASTTTAKSSKKTVASRAVKAPRAARVIKKNKKEKTWLVAIPVSPWRNIDIDLIDRFDEKRKLSKKLTDRKPVADKFLPQGEPRVWAESRQSLCETLPYFKKPQGGCYQNDGHVYGFLFDGLGHCREYVDEDVIICRAGGGMEADGSTGYAQGKNQTFKEAQVQAMLNDIKHQNPVVVICGNRNEAALVKMPHHYCVLGWYKPTMVWSEKTSGKGKNEFTTVKYRLERLNRQEPAWHAPTGREEITDEDKALAGSLYKQACPGCKTVFPQVYLRHWVCLNADCDSFWKYGGVSLPTGTDLLEYNPAFLLHDYGSWKAEDSDAREPEPIDLRPPIPDVDKYTLGDNLAYINTRGICCDKCGRCSARRFFHGWICENPTCDRKVLPQHQIVKPEMMHTPWDNAPTLLRNAAPVLLRGKEENPGVELKVTYKFGYKIATYRFHKMGIEGSFVHAAPTQDILKLPNEANQMFAELQTVDMGLERRAFAIQKLGGVKGKGEVANDDKSEVLPSAEPEGDDASDAAGPKEAKPEFAPGDLMTAFSMNYGMPYKFVATGASKPFTDAPNAVCQVRRVLNWAQQHLLEGSTTEFQDFNEELIFAYMSGQKIEYHDDGEEGLGPRIASLSLGCRAKMQVRLKMKHHVGCSKTGIFTEEKPVKGGFGGAAMDAQRLAAWNELQVLKDADNKAGYKALRTELPKRLGLLANRMKKAEDLVTVSLSHGDIMVMDGYDVQKYLEHKVMPEGCLRFAMTCRTVQENHLKEDERPSYTVEPDEEVYMGPAV